MLYRKELNSDFRENKRCLLIQTRSNRAIITFEMSTRARDQDEDSQEACAMEAPADDPDPDLASGYDLDGVTSSDESEEDSASSDHVGDWPRLRDPGDDDISHQFQALRRTRVRTRGDSEWSQALVPSSQTATSRWENLFKPQVRRSLRRPPGLNESLPLPPDSVLFSVVLKNAEAEIVLALVKGVPRELITSFELSQVDTRSFAGLTRGQWQGEVLDTIMFVALEALSRQRGSEYRAVIRGVDDVKLVLYRFYQILVSLGDSLSVLGCGKPDKFGTASRIVRVWASRFLSSFFIGGQMLYFEVPDAYPVLLNARALDRMEREHLDTLEAHLNGVFGAPVAFLWLLRPASQDIPLLAAEDTCRLLNRVLSLQMEDLHLRLAANITKGRINKSREDRWNRRR